MKAAGYGITKDGALVWVPPGWVYTPPHRLTPDRQSEQALAAAQAAHERRIRQPGFHEPDWPPFLVAFHPRRALTWRCVTLHPLTGKRASSWHSSRDEALAHGYDSR